MDRERWLPVVGYEGRYEVSSKGRVRSLTAKVFHRHIRGAAVGYVRKGRILKPGFDRLGYCKVKLYAVEGTGAKVFAVHRLVANAFVPNSFSKPFVNHKNGLKADNYYKNLEWVTCSENGQHAVRVLKIKTPDVSVPVKVTWTDGEQLIFKSVLAAANYLTLTAAAVSWNAKRPEFRKGRKIEYVSAR